MTTPEERTRENIDVKLASAVAGGGCRHKPVS